MNPQIQNEAVEKMTDIMARFVAFSGKILPDDVMEKLTFFRSQETSPLASTIYDTMFKNQELARILDRPCCQDTGVIQFFVKCGTSFPLIGSLEKLLARALPGWRGMLKPGGTVAVSFNAQTLKPARVHKLMAEAGLSPVEETADGRFAHWVEQAVTRDLAVARRD